jgi:hypothetical protein
MDSMKRWTKVGSGMNPSKRQLSEAEAKVEAVKAVRENRLRDADPADLEAATAVADELFDEGPDHTAH